jgi:hypothetical protein
VQRPHDADPRKHRRTALRRDQDQGLRRCLPLWRLVLGLRKFGNVVAGILERDEFTATSGTGSSNARFQPRSGTRPPIMRHRPAGDAVHFRDSPTSTHNWDSIHSGENSDIGSERVVESCTFGGAGNVGRLVGLQRIAAKIQDLVEPVAWRRRLSQRRCGFGRDDFETMGEKISHDVITQRGARRPQPEGALSRHHQANNRAASGNSISDRRSDGLR